MPPRPEYLDHVRKVLGEETADALLPLVDRCVAAGLPEKDVAAIILTEVLAYLAARIGWDDLTEITAGIFLEGQGLKKPNMGGQS